MAKKNVDREKDLSRLRKKELLEIMLAQSREIDRLRKELNVTKRELQKQKERIDRAAADAGAGDHLKALFREALEAADDFAGNLRNGESGDEGKESGK